MSDTMAHYNQGFGKQGVSIRGMPVLNSYGGNVHWVDSGGSSNGAGNFQRPWTSIDTAVGQCTANNGDIIMVKPGHAESVTAAAGLDLDVAGITILFLGNDNDRGTITFSGVVGADMDVDAADITMIGARFVMGLDNVTAPIDINAARFTLLNTIIEDAAAMAPPDWIVADANADDLTIDGLVYRESTTGTQNESLIQIAAATRPTLRNIRATGDFATGIIENGTAWIDATLENLVLDNSNASPTVCVFLSATSTGWFRNSALRVASGATGYTATNTMQISNVVVTGTDGNVAADPTVGNLEDAAATGAVTTTDTLVSYIKQLVTMMGPTQLDTDTLGSLLAGTAGIATMPNAADPANNVNAFELLRAIWANTCGTAAGENGITTFPAAAVPGNNVSLAEVLRDVWDALRNGTGGSEPGTDKSVIDAIGFNGAAAVAASAGMLRTMTGTTFVVKKTLTSSAVTQAGVDVTAVSTVGDIFIEDVVVTADGTGLAAGTNFTLETNNTKGATAFLSNAITALGANGNLSLQTATVRENTVLETGKKIIAKCTTADCTGSGTIDVYLICRRLADNATLTAA